MRICTTVRLCQTSYHASKEDRQESCCQASEESREEGCSKGQESCCSEACCKEGPCKKGGRKEDREEEVSTRSTMKKARSGGPFSLAYGRSHPGE